ncbi:hypothetical protein DIPPA_05780 [Diplonema papillatum]|nr:hypothetical protein DIPPA_05780 [Diplonema papillatum]
MPIDCGASLTIVNNAKRTPLHQCCESNFSVELCKAMLSGGVDLDAKDDKGKTAYDLRIDVVDVDADDDAALAIAAKELAFLAPSSAASHLA